MVHEYGNTLLIKVVTPQRLIYSNVAEMALIPGSEGYFGVLPGHIPFISSLKEGLVTTYVNQKIDRKIYVSQGFAQVSDNTVYILSEFARCIDEIDNSAIAEQIKKLELALKDCYDESKKRILERDLERYLRLLNFLQGKKVSE